MNSGKLDNDANVRSGEKCSVWKYLLSKFLSLHCRIGHISIGGVFDAYLGAWTLNFSVVVAVAALHLASAVLPHSAEVLRLVLN